MTTDYRALCAELLDEFVYHTDWSYAEELKDRARAALAEQPVRQSQRRCIYNPVQIAECGGPCEQIGPEACDCGALWVDQNTEQPVGPTDDELREMFNENDWNYISPETFEDIARTVLACWGNHPAKPNSSPADGEVGEGPPAVTTGAWLHPAYEPGDGSADGAQMVELAWWHPQFGCDSLQMVVDNARAILARWGNHQVSLTSSTQPLPEGNHPAKPDGSPADGEVGELVAWLKENAEDERQMSNGDNPASLNLGRAADLLQRQYPQPVPVSERWPEFSDCDDTDRVWCWNWAIGAWRLNRINRSIHSHWLPAHALPLPEQEVSE